MHERTPHLMRCLWLSGLACLLTAATSMAQDGKSTADNGKADEKSTTRAEKPSADNDTPKAKPGEEKPKADNGNPERDPFAPTSLLRDPSARQPGQVQFRPSESADAVPVLMLRGFAQVKDQPPVALLEVKGEGVFLVREDDTISLQHGRTNTVLKVKALQRGTAVVEVGTLGKVVVVR